MTKTHALALIAGKSILGATMATGLLLSPNSHAHVVASDIYAWEMGDDNADGVIDEDESGWNCSEMGNLSCEMGITP